MSELLVRPVSSLQCPICWNRRLHTKGQACSGGCCSRGNTFMSDNRVDEMNREAQSALREAHMPNRQTEDFRFTDLSLITRSTIQVARRYSFQSGSVYPS